MENKIYLTFLFALICWDNSVILASGTTEHVFIVLTLSIATVCAMKRFQSLWWKVDLPLFISGLGKFHAKFLQYHKLTMFSYDFFADISGSSELHVKMKNMWNINALQVTFWHFVHVMPSVSVSGIPLPGHCIGLPLPLPGLAMWVLASAEFPLSPRSKWS